MTALTKYIIDELQLSTSQLANLANSLNHQASIHLATIRTGIDTKDPKVITTITVGGTIVSTLTLYTLVRTIQRRRRNSSAAQLQDQKQSQQLSSLLPPGLSDITSLDQLFSLAGRPSFIRTTLDYISSIKAGSVTITNQGLDNIPTRVFAIGNLVQLDLSHNTIIGIPASLGTLTTLTRLDLSNNNIKMIPPSVCKNLKNLQDLNVANNHLMQLPSNIGDLVELKYLNLMGNQLRELPESIGELRNLHRLGLKSNRLKVLPVSIGKLDKLVELFLTDNALTELPREMGGMKRLVKCQASFNALQTIPEEIFALPHLELLRVACCAITDINIGGSSPKLAWVSIAGNPCCPRLPAPKKNANVKFTDIMIGEKLGDGASGEVFLSIWQGKRVALKIYSVSEIGPDGHARDEIGIAAAVSDKHLVKVLGLCQQPLSLITELAADKRGMPLRPLALKPNHESLLRCRWEAGVCFSLMYVLNVAAGIASALEKMHSKGISHGDVYAHNVLSDAEGNNVILCDYGAAFCYNKNSSNTGSNCQGNNKVSFEKLDVRGFGLLLSDMVNRLDITFEAMEFILDVQKQLLALVQICTTGQVVKRPLFGDVVKQLKGLQKSAGKVAVVTP
jgi:Leucine-rich repeat (LRR) protein